MTQVYPCHDFVRGSGNQESEAVFSLTLPQLLGFSVFRVEQQGQGI